MDLKDRKAKNKRDERARKSHDGLFKAREYYTHDLDEVALRRYEAELRKTRIALSEL